MQEELFQRVQQAGFRLTRARKEIVATFTEATRPLSAIELRLMLSSMPNKSTIYRELLFLMQQGIVVEVQLRPDITHYELAGQVHHHHLVCNRCDGVEDVVLGDDLHQLEAQIAIGKRFKVERHSLEFYGLCGKCQTAG